MNSKDNNKGWVRIGNYECPTRKITSDCVFLGERMDNNSVVNTPNTMSPSKKKVNTLNSSLVFDKEWLRMHPNWTRFRTKKHNLKKNAKKR